MAERIEFKQVTFAIGTTATTPVTTALSFDPCDVVRLEVIVPPGPSGFMGFRFIHSGQVIIPYQADAWVITDNEKLDWPLEGYPTNNKWSVQGYNTGLFPHTIYMRFHVNEIPSKPTAALTAVPIE